MGDRLSDFEGALAQFNDHYFKHYRSSTSPTPVVFPNCASDEAWNVVQREEKIKQMFTGARRRHQEMQRVDSTLGDFELTPEKIRQLLDATPVCPITKLPFRCVVGDGASHPHKESPSIDKIVPHLGYVETNCKIVSFKGNMLKGMMTREYYTNLGNYMTSVGL
ncbi:hypothetical protein TrVE_jg8791 [Triparma verrucosa]|uniref:Uncharacterized protein n=1 Tax=Triparma verrucosa TaxID=1606542 RepID=A0A9W7C2A0_9STRA|nr:hypothetical protein TrVE_jg8791 [Triparma verrucosa]